jgi:hypothetical protein
MAVSITQLNAITHVMVLKKLTDQVFNTNAALKRAYEKRVRLDGGTKIGAPVAIPTIDSATGTWYSGMENLDAAESDDISRAEVEWKQLHETVLISRADVLKNSGTMQQLNLVAEKVKLAQGKMKVKLATGLHSDGTTNTKAFNGLQQIIHASGDYAGFAIGDFKMEDGTTNAWVSYIKSNSGTARQLSLALVQQTMGGCTFDSEKPTYAISRQAAFNELWNLLSPHQRLMTDDEMSGLGFKGTLQFNGIPWLVDSHAKQSSSTNGSFSFINEDHFKLYVHKDEDMKVQSFDQLENQNGIKRRVLLMGNVLCDGRRYLGELSDISISA